MKILIISILIILCSSLVFATLNDTLTTSNSLLTNQTLISSGGKFEFGFFNRGNPSKYYIGIWYKDIPSENIIVWVGNRGSPLLSNIGFLKLGNDSTISLFDDNSRIVWQTNNSNSNSSSSFVLQLLDSGNLVIREEGDSNPSSFFWESFDDPTDTLIPGQRFGWNLKTGSNRFLSSWLNPDDPSMFKPNNSFAWSLRDGTDGCARDTQLDCKSDGFLPLYNMKLPETYTSVVDTSLSLDECRDMCKRNCTCTAYANSEFSKGVGSGCVTWTDNLNDMRDYVDGGQTLYIRLAEADLPVVESSPAKGSSNSNSTKKVAMGVGITVAAAIILTGLIILIINSRKISRNVQRVARSGGIKGRSQENLFSGHTMSSMVDDSGEANNDDDHELLMFDFYSMGVATYNFSKANKLGQGGFGLVYKGVMLDGKEVAIKRLSKESGQGSEEFKNELRLIAKLQHRNLVRLLGCCVDKDEKMLIYEYLVNRSLDSLLFNKERSYLLNWQTRFNIICGIARGLLYLHQDSRYRIIHRDLKASNILLDAYMTPKISDFGMARIFGGDEIEGNTRRVVGTYGYMAPEYAMDGVFSIKSDVFSFGVLVLEILNGTKNRGFYRANNELNLLGYSWKQWREGKGTEMLDKAIGEEYSTDEVLRCLQVGLLCVQERPEDRPTMGNVVLMLSSETTSLPMPKLPGFCVERNPNETESSSSKRDESLTVNQVTITTLNAR